MDPGNSGEYVRADDSERFEDAEEGVEQQLSGHSDDERGEQSDDMEHERPAPRAQNRRKQRGYPRGRRNRAPTEMETCELCGVKYGNDDAKESHLKGKKHERSLRRQKMNEQRQNDKRDRVDITHDDMSPGAASPRSNDSFSAEEEQETNIPKENLREITYEMNGLHKCQICNIFSTTLESHNRHLAGARHKQKLEEFNAAPSVSSISDSVGHENKSIDREDEDSSKRDGSDSQKMATVTFDQEGYQTRDLRNAVGRDLQQLLADQQNIAYMSPSSSVMAVKDFDGTSRTSDAFASEDDLPPLELLKSRKQRSTSMDFERSINKAPELGMSRVVFIGTGWSTSTPVPHCILSKDQSCSVCLSAYHRPLKSRNKRGNTSILIQYSHPDPEPTANGGRESIRNIQIDLGKTFRENALRYYPRNRVTNIDAVILTHDHADAVLGLDDIRGFQNRDAPKSVPIYCSDTTFERVKKLFPYLVEEESISSDMEPKETAQETGRSLPESDVDVHEELQESKHGVENGAGSDTSNQHEIPPTSEDPQQSDQDNDPQVISEESEVRSLTPEEPPPQPEEDQEKTPNDDDIPPLEQSSPSDEAPTLEANPPADANAPSDEVVPNDEVPYAGSQVDEEPIESAPVESDASAQNPQEPSHDDVLPEPAEGAQDDVLPEPVEGAHDDVLPEPAEGTHDDMLPDLAVAGGTQDEVLQPEPAEDIQDDVFPEPEPEPAEDVQDGVLPEPEHEPVADIQDDVLPGPDPEPAEPAQDDVLPAEPAQDDVLPAEPAQDDVLPAEPAQDDVLPAEPAQDDVLPAEPAQDDVLPAEPAQDDVLPAEPAQDDVLPAGPAPDDVLPAEPTQDDVLPESEPTEGDRDESLHSSSTLEEVDTAASETSDFQQPLNGDIGAQEEHYVGDVYDDGKSQEYEEKSQPHVRRVVSSLTWKPVLDNMRSCEISGLPILCFPVMHGEDYETFGFEFGQQERVIYLPDVSRIPQASLDFLRSRPIDLLILDCIFRTTSHSTHFTWKDSLECVADLQPKRTYFVGMSHEFDHHSTNKVLSDLYRSANRVQLAHDGLTVDVML